MISSERESSLESICDLVRYVLLLDDNCLDLESCWELIVLLVCLFDCSSLRSRVSLNSQFSSLRVKTRLKVYIVSSCFVLAHN